MNDNTLRAELEALANEWAEAEDIFDIGDGGLTWAAEQLRALLDRFPSGAEGEAVGQCSECGRNPATGHASVWTRESGQVWLCHGDDDPEPTCYQRANHAPRSNALLAAHPVEARDGEVEGRCANVIQGMRCDRPQGHAGSHRSWPLEWLGGSTEDHDG